MSIREIYPGGTNGASYVELQMWTAGQNLVGTHHLVAYNANGSVNENFALPSNVANGANQATILVADSEYFPRFDEKPAPDASDANLNLSPAGGAVCWIEGAPPDCVAWGNFTGPLPSHLPELKVGSPASPGGVSAGKALRRSIATGCSTLLDPPPTDDSDNSAADFSEQEPNPRDNATPPVEHACPLLPNTVLDTTPANPTKATSAGFSYHAVPATEASFECRLDGAVFASCPSSSVAFPGPLAEGSHSFEVRAVNMAGADATPAAYSWTIDTTPPTATVKTHPVDPSPGASAAFTYQSSEAASKFECSLASGAGPDAFASCPTVGKTYTGLADSTYIFKVRATDAATNQGLPASFEWTVDNSLADTTPPETTILARPPDPSGSSTASFTYESNEPGSSFECSIDGTAFAACPATGVSYAGLGNGSHTFQARAVDPSNNADPSPAGYSFQIVLAPAALPGPPPPPPLQPTVPETSFSSKPAVRTHDRTPTFRFRAKSAGATFQCKLDGAPFKACRSPFTTKTLSYGSHTLQVRALTSGMVDPTPAKVKFTVVRK
jgi:hypothetical protein